MKNQNKANPGQCGASCYADSVFRHIGYVTLGCISPEARDLLDKIMGEWEIHLAEMKKQQGENYEPSYYGFAYWLVRWSGLIRGA
jgi:hypothetical protein